MEYMVIWAIGVLIGSYFGYFLASKIKVEVLPKKAQDKDIAQLLMEGRV